MYNNIIINHYQCALKFYVVRSTRYDKHNSYNKVLASAFPCSAEPICYLDKDSFL